MNGVGDIERFPADDIVAGIAEDSTSASLRLIRLLLQAQRGGSIGFEIDQQVIRCGLARQQQRNTAPQYCFDWFHVLFLLLFDEINKYTCTEQHQRKPSCIPPYTG